MNEQQQPFRSKYAPQTQSDRLAAESVLWQRRSASANLIYTGLTLLIFFGSIVSVALSISAVKQAGRAADAASRQAEIAADTEIRQLRAYIYVLGMPFKNFGATKPVETGVIAKNGGETPASQVVNTIYMAVLKYPLDVNVTTFQVAPQTKATRSFLYRDMELDTSIVSPRLLSDQETALVTDGRTQRIYVWGEITYSDAFEKQRYVHYCYNFDGPGIAAGNVHLCDQYNDAD